MSGVEKSQIKNIAEISPCVPFGHLVCGFPKGALRKVASLRSSREMTGWARLTLGRNDKTIVVFCVLSQCGRVVGAPNAALFYILLK